MMSRHAAGWRHAGHFMRALACAVAIALAGTAPLAAQTAAPGKPPVPPGKDPGGIAIALVSSGVDYTQSDISKRLARDGEGELIGIDLVDGDHRPWAPFSATAPLPEGGNGTENARQVLSIYRYGRLVPIRVRPDDAKSLAMALSFAASTPARIVVVPMWSGKAETWQPFREAATHYKDLLVIVPAGDPEAVAAARPQWPAALRLPNIVSVAVASDIAERRGALRPAASLGLDALVLPRGSSMFGILPNAPPRNGGEAAALAAGLAACAQHRAPAETAETARRALLALAVPGQSIGGVPALDPVCLYGGTRY